MSAVSVLLADDHAILRAGLTALLQGKGNIEVVGEAASLAEAVERSRELRPDVVVLDLSMPGGGLNAIPGILAGSPDSRIVVLTMHDDPAYVRAALQAGVSGYLLKSIDYSELSTAIRAAREGRIFLSVPFQESAARDRPEPPSRPPSQPLSEREQQVLTLIAQGLTYREIAERLHLSERSVETYRNRLAEKIGAKSRAELVRHALRSGLVDA